MFQTPIPAPYSQDIKDKLKGCIKPAAPGNPTSELGWHKGDPLPTAAHINTVKKNDITRVFGYNVGTTQQALDNFAANRDFLLDIAGDCVVFNQDAVNLLPNLTRTGELYLGTLIGEPALIIKTKKPMRNGYTDHMHITSYIPDLLATNPDVQVFAGFSLIENGCWVYHKAPVIEHAGQILFIENHGNDLAYLGKIYPKGDPGPVQPKPKGFI